MSWKDILLEPIEIQLFQGELAIILWCLYAIVRDTKRFIAEVRNR